MHRPLILTTLAILVSAPCHGTGQRSLHRAELYLAAVEAARTHAPTANKRFDWEVERFQALVRSGRSAQARSVFLEACAEYSFRPALTDFSSLLDFSIRRGDLSLTQYLLHLAEQELPSWQQDAEPLESARLAAIALAGRPPAPNPGVSGALASSVRSTRELGRKP